MASLQRMSEITFRIQSNQQEMQKLAEQAIQEQTHQHTQRVATLQRIDRALGMMHGTIGDMQSLCDKHWARATDAEPATRLKA
mmetsp:Transcript_7819/g.21459  ORF Transcript_7819/g.21459 Transcript_7819/m.21459 type:complete len:83 (-) Transcript_7819:101-349(-)|eukprot:CAMPEP_0194506118 /NCGR_PEP_ID=MMETSP0253-20130528/33837_1 /TAXON_ID=2966 /ORGANISM="Noctiluca scintillans" /LENGTH=82 /DNA_ID=CAMNT_0039348773 /DNA_START=13 /DNA_END=261 /DNA_ORIENTATION=+